MKIIKKIAAIMLSVMMVLGMCSVVGAEGTTTSETGTSGVTGSITISNAIDKQEYKIYRILELESYDKTNGLYSYKPNSSWKAFFDDKSDPKGAGSDYITVDDNGYARWKGAETDERKREFAKLALEYAKDKTISANAKKTANASDESVTTTELTFQGLQLGYYLVDSSAGALCSLDTTNLDATIQEKNGVPSVEKEVQEDSNNRWDKNNTADIGQTVNFKTTITAQAGAQSYVLHDKMDAGLTFNDSTVKVQTKVEGEVAKDVNTGYEVKRDELGETPPNVCTFHIEFDKTFCDGLQANEKIIITYSATLNKDAIVGKKGNENKTWLNYGDSSKTEESKTTTYTFEIPVFKYTKDASENKKALEKAEFTLSKSEKGTDPIELVDITASDETNKTYRVATEIEKSASPKGTITTVTTPSTGKFKIQGLDADIYYLTETKQPDGYNKLSAPITVVIDENGNITVNGQKSSVTEVKVLNNTGTILPTTGGNGTSLIYFLGAVLALVSGVVLITKQRMKNS